jgi:hydrogenase expression/formation protein HypD
MKYQDEYRDAQSAARLCRAIKELVRQTWTIMEVCGGQTHSIVRYGLSDLLPQEINLVHGPGCPVCVTPTEMLDQAVAIAQRGDVIFCSFGDMLRVPGNSGSLLDAKSGGADVRVVYSPLDALRLAEHNPHRQVVFFAVGFETTAPANAMALREARRRRMENFSALVSHVLVPPAMAAILASDQNRVQGFLAAGHVCAVTGYEAYECLARQKQVPIVVTGFEPLDLLEGIYHCVAMLEQGRIGVENQYARVVRREGNRAAQDVVDEVFQIVDRSWRGIGPIPASGYQLRDEYASFDAQRRFPLACTPTASPTECISGEILQGYKKPGDCPAFGIACTPDHPLGATMVSSEGACAAYYHYRRQKVSNLVP